MHAGDLSEVAPVTICIARFDPLRDGETGYAERLVNGGLRSSIAITRP